MNREFDIIIKQDADGWYVGSVPALRGCHTQARSLDELRERIFEAIQLCLEVEDEEEQLDFRGPIPRRSPQPVLNTCGRNPGRGGQSDHHARGSTQ